MTDYARPLAQETKEGRSFPLGATLSAEGANFSVYSKHATGSIFFSLTLLMTTGPSA